MRVLEQFISASTRHFTLFHVSFILNGQISTTQTPSPLITRHTRHTSYTSNASFKRHSNNQSIFISPKSFIERYEKLIQPK